MAKKVIGYIKLQIPAGKANPSPPVGPALGQRGLNIMEFCKAFNAATQGMEVGLPVPVVITEMVMPGDNVSITVALIAPIAMEDGLRFAIREGGRTVGAGVVAKIIE